MGLLLVPLLGFFFLALILAVLVRSPGARLAILIFVPVTGTLLTYLVFFELYIHGKLGGT